VVSNDKVSRATYKQWVRAMLDGYVVSTLRLRGFDFKGLTFSRTTKMGVAQKILFNFAVRPPYAPYHAHLFFDVWIDVPQAASTYDAMMRSAPESMRSGPPVTTPIDRLKENPGDLWLLDSPESALELGDIVNETIINYVIPHCDGLNAPTKVVTYCIASIQRGKQISREHGLVDDLITPRGVFAAAVAITIGDHETAREVLDISYPVGGVSRARYRTAFEYMDRAATGAPQT
jgi:hypothetical protein